MKVSGFTFVRNAVKFDYPIIEAISSILSLCDEFIVLVGNSDDGTRELIAGIQSNKIKIVDSVWDDSLREGGRVLWKQTRLLLRYRLIRTGLFTYRQMKWCMKSTFLS
jgi:glycosyltransferase involved in cell wall biosynthesis